MSEDSDNIKGFFLIPNKETWRKGYIFPVRSRLNNMLENEFIPEEFKDKYLEMWGEDIIYEDEFIEWYCEMKQNNPKVNSL